MWWREDKTKTVRDQKGQVLWFTLMVMIFGALVIAGLFAYLSTSLLVSARSQENTYAYYAANAGVERVIAELLRETGTPLEQYSVTLNGYTATVEVDGDWTSPIEIEGTYKDYKIVSTVTGADANPVATITCYTRQMPDPTADPDGPWTVTILSWQIE